MSTQPTTTDLQDKTREAMNRAASRAHMSHLHGPWMVRHLRRQADILEAVPATPHQWLPALAQGINAEAISKATMALISEGYYPNSDEFANQIARWIEDNVAEEDSTLPMWDGEHPQAPAVRSLLSMLANEEWVVTHIDDGGDEGVVKAPPTIELQAADITAVDECRILLSGYHQGTKYTPSLFLVFGNSDSEIVCDGSASPEFLWELISKWSESME